MSGYHLHQGASLDSFPIEFPELFIQKDPLDIPVYLVVQNAGLGEWLIRRLAGHTGAVMGQRILLPEQALRIFAGGYPAARKMVSSDGDDPGIESSTLARGEGRGLLFMDSLKLAIFKALDEIVSGEEPLYAHVRDYVRSDEGRLWQLSDAVAGIFYHYGMNCLPLVESWDRGELHLDPRDPRSGAEAWQKELWRRIFHGRAPYTHLSRVLSETMSSGDRYDGPEARVILFGSMFLGDTGLRFFRHLARSLEVHHFLFTPSSFLPGAVPVTPFLRDNSKLARDFAALLPDLEPDNPEESIRTFPATPATDESLPAGNTSLLDRFRNALSEDRTIEAGSINDDGSLLFHDVVGLRRQVQVLKDRILEALRDDESLAPTDIGVLAPDISAYAPYIETVFPGKGQDGRDNLSFNLSDLPGRSEAPYPSAFDSLLELPGSRFGRNTLLKLFGNPCFVPTAADPETARVWRLFTENLNVRWGTDSEHRRSSGSVDGETGSWETAFERLLAGFYHDDDDDPRRLPATLRSGSDAEAAGHLIHTLHSLDEELRQLDKRRQSLKKWVLDWERLVDTWLVPRRDNESDESDRLAVKRAIRDLLALEDDLYEFSDFADDTIPWSAFSTLLREFASSGGGRKGRYLSRGVTCASLKPMRAIPFRRIYILGMDEAVWPGREYLTGFDLRESVGKTIDLSRESVDRFAIMESLFSAKDHLSFFFSGRDPERGDALTPATPVAELWEYLGPGYPTLLRVHPLVSWDAAALGRDSRLATSSIEALELAESRRKGPPVRPRMSDILLPENQDSTLDWKELLAYMRNPAAAFYRKRLGVPPDYAVEEDGEHDILEADFLDWWSWRNDAVAEDPSLLKDPDYLAEGFARHLDRSGAVSRTFLAGLSEAERRNDSGELALQAGRLLVEGLAPGASFSLILDPVTHTVDGSTEPGGLLRVPAPRIPLPGGRDLRITGRIGGLRLLHRDGVPVPSVWTRAGFINGDKVKPSHNLESWIQALLIGTVAADFADAKVFPGQYRQFRLGGHNLPARRYYFPGATVSGEEGGEKRYLADAPALLNLLCRLRDRGMTEPVLLHPELAEKLQASEKQSGHLEGEALAEAAADAWSAIVSNDRGYSGLRDCSFRRRFVDRPDFSGLLFADFWQHLYREGGIL